MKHTAIAVLMLLTACSTVTSDSTQDITVTTEPAGAACTLSNGFGSVQIAETPSTVTVHRSFTPLTISCGNGTQNGTATLEAHTRGRAYGNLLLLGIPAAVDAGTGYGYEYQPDSTHIELQAN